MSKGKILTAEEIELEPNMAVMKLDLVNSGRENFDSDDYYNSDFEDDDPYSPQMKLFQNFQILSKAWQKKNCQESPATTIEEPFTSHTSVSQHAEFVGIQETTN
ncbi:hypothetical protein FQA39_LY03302 [Lamprigera yunnana]|nr:hypothetical protein FQA39_LY03302 [Lamprigera yunnana]